jgi:hypothetical protein
MVLPLYSSHEVWIWFVDRRTTMKGLRRLAYVGLAANGIFLLWLLIAGVMIGQPPIGGVHLGDLYATEGTTMKVRDGALNLVPGTSGEFGLTAPVVQWINLAFLAVFFLAVLIGCVLLLRWIAREGQRTHPA